MGTGKKSPDEGALFEQGENLDKADKVESLPEAPDMGLAKPLTEMYDEAHILEIERAAEYAPRLLQAIRKILVTVAFDGDWSQHGKVACLGSAGAERYLAHFKISFSDWHREKTEWKDELGEAYRWRYWATVEWNGRKILAEGRYSTRDKFLGKKSGEFRPLTEIDESDIQSAAQHICQGAGIKALLGLRGIKVEELIRLGVDRNKIADAGYVEGTKGGATGDEKKLQSEIRGWLLQVCANDENEAKKLLVVLTAYKAKKDYGKYKKGDEVPGVQTASALKGVSLKIAHEKAKKQFDEWEADHKGGE